MHLRGTQWKPYMKPLFLDSNGNQLITVFNSDFD